MRVDSADFMIVSIGELNTNKNHEAALNEISYLWYRKFEKVFKPLGL